MRRSVPPLVLVAMMAACTKQCPPRKDEPPPPPPAPPTATACPEVLTLAAEGDVLRVAVDVDGVPATFERRTKGSGTTQLQEIVTVGGATVIEADAVVKQPGRAGTRVRTKLGANAPELVITSDDGQNFAGTVNGKPLERFERGTPLEKLRLADGSRMPDAPADPALERVLERLFNEVDRRTQACSTSDGRGGASGGVGTTRSALTSTTGVPRWTHSSTGCVACRAAAIAGGAACVIAVSKGCTSGAAICGPWYGVCWGACMAVGVAVCIGLQVVALDACWSGGACCPVGCPGGMGKSCCEGGDTCLDPGRGLCCAPGLTACGTTSCCAPGSTCMADQTCCPNTVCKGKCCGFGESCTSLGCCSAACGGTCCTLGQFCADATRSLCCGVGAKVCNGQCCGGNGEQCIGNTCCPGARSCGNTCCPEGQKCADPATGRCSLCPAGEVSCNPVDICTGGAPLAPTMCCAPGVACCAEGCCKPGESCVRGTCRTGGSWGCVR